jgi:phospholipase/carboxylesterase
VSGAAESYAYHAEGRAEGRPLVFVFHGTGGTEAQFVPLVRELMPGAAIVAPRGDVSERGALRFFRRRGEGRYDMEDLAARTAAMIGFLEAHAAIGAPSRVLGLGYSNGANILASVIFARPKLFDAAVLMHPLIPWTPDPAPVRTRVLITAGERDPICPPEATRALEAWFRERGAPVKTHWHMGGHEIDRSEITAVADLLRATGEKQE